MHPSRDHGQTGAMTAHSASSGDTPPPEPMEQVQVDPDEGYAVNRDNWDGRARVHLGSVGYGVEELIADPDGLSAVARRDLGLWRPHLPPDNPTGLEGLSLVHLQCHIGTDTLSLARLGARCTGVDLSPVSLKIAQDLADRADVQVRYVEANVVDAAAAVGEQVDLVYTSTGTICWVQDLVTWGRQVAALLRPGGTFFFRDAHPLANALADDDPTALTTGYRYFPLAPGQALTYADGVTYTDGDQSLITQPRNYEWPHSVSEVLMALILAGLEIVEVDEQDDLPWPIHPAMVPEGEAHVLPEPWREQFPVAWSVVARKPGDRHHAPSL